MSNKRLGDNLEVTKIHPRSFSVSNRRPLRRPASNISTTQPVPETRVMMVPAVNPHNQTSNHHTSGKNYYPYSSSGGRRRSYTMCSGVVSSWPRSW